MGEESDSSPVLLEQLTDLRGAQHLTALSGIPGIVLLAIGMKILVENT